VAYTIRDPELERLLIALSELRDEARIALVRRWAKREMKELRAELRVAKPWAS
jgi:hypothetical protein